LTAGHHYGHHLTDVCFDRVAKPFNVVAVDPGHVDLMSAARAHISDQTLPFDAGGTSKRKCALAQKLTTQKRSEFRLSNVQWQHDTGQLTRRGRELQLQQKLPLYLPAVARLALHSARTASVRVYAAHALARVQTAPALATRNYTKAPRRWQFDVYQREQREAQKLSHALLGGLDRSNTLVVWGDGGFAPTSKGHAAAPNLKLQNLLVRQGCALVTSSEFRSSQTSCCCHAPLRDLRSVAHRTRGTRVTVKKCTQCLHLVGRDASAAHVIADIFAFQRGLSPEIQAKRQDTLPPWLLAPKIPLPQNKNNTNSSGPHLVT
jgi:hypothetical protein